MYDDYSYYDDYYDDDYGDYVEDDPCNCPICQGIDDYDPADYDYEDDDILGDTNQDYL